MFIPTSLTVSPRLVLSIWMVESKSTGRRSLLDGASNFRDLGGYRTVDKRVVRDGMVFRSGALHALTDADHQRLRELGVRVAVDLRPPEEQAAEPTNVSFIRIVHVPLLRGERTSDPSALANGEGYLRDRYTEIVLDRAPDIGVIFQALADEDGLPAIIHCAAGKDRTGVVSAILLLALGVDEPTVLDDYELTSEYAAREPGGGTDCEALGVGPAARGRRRPARHQSPCSGQCHRDPARGTRNDRRLPRRSRGRFRGGSDCAASAAHGAVTLEARALANHWLGDTERSDHLLEIQALRRAGRTAMAHLSPRRPSAKTLPWTATNLVKRRQPNCDQRSCPRLKRSYASADGRQAERQDC